MTQKARIETDFRIALGHLGTAYERIMRLTDAGLIQGNIVLAHLDQAINELRLAQHEAAATHGFTIKLAAGNQLQPPTTHHHRSTP